MLVEILYFNEKADAGRSVLVLKQSSMYPGQQHFVQNLLNTLSEHKVTYLDSGGMSVSKTETSTNTNSVDVLVVQNYDRKLEFMTIETYSAALDVHHTVNYCTRSLHLPIYHLFKTNEVSSYIPSITEKDTNNTHQRERDP